VLLCAMDKVTKIWNGTTVLQELSLEIRERERIGIVGPNGCGKTTVLKLLAGEEIPDAGAIHFKKGSRTALLAQIPDFGPEATAGAVLQEAFAELLDMQARMAELGAAMASPDSAVVEKALREYGALEDAFSAKGGYEMEASLSRIASGLGIEPLQHLPFSRLSGGERTKVCLGRLLLLQPDLLLLDEPTNHLDLDAVEWLEDYLQEYCGSVAIVSHDRYFLDRTVTKIFDLEGGKADVYHGNYSYFTEEKERRLLAEFAAYQEQQKKIRKMEEAIKRLRTWAAQADNPALFKRAAAMQKALDRLDKLERPVLERQKIGLAFRMSERSGEDVVVMKDVSKSYGPSDGEHADSRGARTLYAGVSLQVRFGEATAIVGKNGSGKSTLLRMIAEGVRPDSGTVHVGVSAKPGYLSQHHEFPDEEMTVVDAFREAVMVEEGKARHLLAKFLFYGASVFRKVKSFSGGERMRLRLAQLMHQDINVLVLDEPTNHLDIDAREALEDTLAEFPGTIICVSHDRYLLNKLFPVTFWLEDGRLTRWEGHYDEAKRKREALRKSSAGAGLSASGRAAAEEAGRASAKSGPAVTEGVSPESGKAGPAASGRRAETREAGSQAPAKSEQAAVGRASARGQRPSSDQDRAKRRLAKLEAEIEAVERQLAELDDAMMREADAKRLEAMYGEKVRLEAERERLYEQLEML